MASLLRFLAPITTAAGAGCNAVVVPEENPMGGRHNVNQWVNPAAFANPGVVTTMGQTDFSPLGGPPTQVKRSGPGFHRLDFSVFKQFRTSETTHFEFRAEIFNLTNTPNFALPSFTNFLNPLHSEKSLQPAILRMTLVKFSLG